MPPKSRTTLTRMSAVSVVSLFALTGCAAGGQTSSSSSAAPSGGSVVAIRARFQQITCAAQPENEVIDDDISNTGRSPALQEARQSIDIHEARRIAMCGGHLRIVGFAGNVANTFTIYDGDLPRRGGTTTAREIEADNAVGQINSAITTNLPAAYNAVDSAGTDILGEFTLAQQFEQQMTNHGQLHLLLETDGINDSGPINLERSLSSSLVTQLVAEAQMPALPGATVTITGIGQTSDSHVVDSSYTEHLLDFWTGVCPKTGATHCQPPTTDFVS